MYRVSNAGEGAVRAAKFDDGSYVGSQADGIVNFNAEINAISEKANRNYGNVNLAVAKVIDGVITEIFVIVPSADEE